MTRYVLRYTGRGPVPAADVARVRERTRVLDAQGRTLLVEAPAGGADEVIDGLDGWVGTPEHVVPLVPVRPRVRATRVRRSA